ncbi:MAG: DNA helicase RecG, partial [Actinobacteria bacterium]|nr:DNA helicase RecG [Actinomycetota bacterium]NIV54969.1 DNA helicase RecG [Actinomycetota bacterium]NIV86323.1 DNA helicase RecG [Actinomycetota bacterium]NIW27125.1 DNA helicase RecG [Actinomycetota bacterium]NIX19677.1 DNA helicase RecG [Actinomycetota bacterium]
MIDPEILDRVGLIDRDSAIAAIHFPEERKEADVARSRLVFDEFFRLEVALARQQYLQVDEAVGVEHHADGPLTGALVDGLPYTLTSAQARVIEEIADDMARPHPMHRLLQGEVGSGKT